MTPERAQTARGSETRETFAERAADRLLQDWHTYRWPDGARAALIETIDDSPDTPDTLAMIEQFCRDLNDAHNEILRLQGVAPDDFGRFDWPEWSAPANSIRWAEKLLWKPLSKTSLREEPR